MAFYDKEVNLYMLFKVRRLIASGVSAPQCLLLKVNWMMFKVNQIPVLMHPLAHNNSELLVFIISPEDLRV